MYVWLHLITFLFFSFLFRLFTNISVLYFVLCIPFIRTYYIRFAVIIEKFKLKTFICFEPPQYMWWLSSQIFLYLSFCLSLSLSLSNNMLFLWKLALKYVQKIESSLWGTEKSWSGRAKVRENELVGEGRVESTLGYMQMQKILAQTYYNLRYAILMLSSVKNSAQTFPYQRVWEWVIQSFVYKYILPPLSSRSLLFTLFISFAIAHHAIIIFHCC